MSYICSASHVACPTCLIIHENREFNVLVVTLHLDAPSNGIFLAIFSVSETPEDAIQFLRHCSFQISGPESSPIYIYKLPGLTSLL